MTSESFCQLLLSHVDEPIPDILVPNILSFKRLYSAYDYRFFNLTSIREWLGDHMGSEILSAFDKLKPLAFKADLARYCLLYELGGWYADISLKPVTGINIDKRIQFVYFYDFGSGSPCPLRSSHDVMNSFFYARARHPILSLAIDHVLKHCRDHYYGPSSLSPTGPILFGRIVAQFAPDPSLLIGHCLQLTPFHNNNNLAYVAQDGTITAWHKSAWFKGHAGGGDLNCFGLIGTNNYHQMWLNRDIYS